MMQHSSGIEHLLQGFQEVIYFIFGSEMPDAGPNSVAAIRWAAHPLYETAPFFYHDVGMVELAEPIYLAEYGTLPVADQFDASTSNHFFDSLTGECSGDALTVLGDVFISEVSNGPHLRRIKPRMFDNQP